VWTQAKLKQVDEATVAVIYASAYGNTAALAQAISPTLGGNMPTPVKEALGVILKDDDARSKPCGVFGSLGWSGEAIDEIEQRLKDGGFSFAFPTIRCTFKPTESTLQICEESGTDLAQAVRKAKRKQKYSSSDAQSLVATNVEQAVGRVVGALCVLSAKNGDAESAMLASWVSQASFVPPGITIAVSLSGFFPH
jgi:flavodoxin